MNLNEYLGMENIKKNIEVNENVNFLI